VQPYPDAERRTGISIFWKEKSNLNFCQIFLPS
jgi:hypothetical protein